MRATLDAAGLSRHFELTSGFFYHMKANSEGDLVYLLEELGGSLTLENVHLVNGRYDPLLPYGFGNGFGQYQAVLPTEFSVGGGCIFVQKGQLLLRRSRLTDCAASTNRLCTEPGSGYLRSQHLG